MVGGNFGGVDVVPLLSAIAGCHCSAMVGGEGDGQLWGSGRGAIAGCHRSVLWLGASMTTNFGGVDVVPLQGAHGILHSNGIRKKHLEKLP